MKQDGKVLYYIFLSIGIVLMLISAAIFYYQYRSTSNVIHTTGVIVDTEWRRGNLMQKVRNATRRPGVPLSPFARRRITRSFLNQRAEIPFMKTAREKPSMLFIHPDNRIRPESIAHG